MNDNIEKNINKTLDWLQQAGAEVQNFTMEQAPLYCQEIVKFYLAKGIFLSISGSIFLILTLVTLWAGLRYDARRVDVKVGNTGLSTQTNPHYDPEVAKAYGFVFLCLAFLTIVTLSPGIYMLIKGNIAPRIVIMEHVQRML